ncbi:MAG: energy transducer TonB [Bryobacteraceae bacterium]
MFEQTYVIQAGRNPWALASAVTLQTSLAAAAIAVSMMHIDLLPRPTMRIGTMGVPARSVKVIDTGARGAAAPSRLNSRAPKIFTPSNVAPLSTATTSELMAIADSALVGDSQATGTVWPGGGIPGGTFFGDAVPVLTPPPPPPPPAKPVEHKAAAPSKPLLVGGAVQAAKLVRQIKPTYPPLARQARISGTVRLEAIISKGGAIQNLRLVAGHPLLAPSAVEAVRQWLYQPTMLNGEPTEVVTQIDVNFMLVN